MASRQMPEIQQEEFDVFAGPGPSSPPGPSGPAAMQVTGDPGDCGEMPHLLAMTRYDREDSDGSDSEGMLEPGRDFSGGSEEESEEDPADDGVTPGRDTVDWKEVGRAGGYEIEDFTPGFVGVNHNLDTSAAAVDFFYLFFDDETFFERVVKETNRYAPWVPAVDPATAAVDPATAAVDPATAAVASATAAVASATAAVASATSSSEEVAARTVDTSWTDTTLPEIKAYIAMNIGMGLRGHTAADDIWRNKDILHDSYLSKIMSRDRFRAISKRIHFVDNTLDPGRGKPNYDPLFKIRPMIDLFNTRAADLYKPKQQLSVDEAMIKFKGQHRFKQYMPKKPVKFGFKVWVCAEADTGYAFQVEVYEGKARTEARVALRTLNGLGFDVVSELTKQYQGKNHVVYIDRFFSSPALAEYLLQHKIYVNSTVMLNRKGLPVAAKKLKLKKTDDCKQYQKGNLLLTVFYDKRQISHLSTGCLPGLEDKAVTPKPLVKEVKPLVKEVKPKPLVNLDYNKYMGGVDLSDQHGSYYPVGRKARKWWKYIFWHFINLAINNAYVLFRATLNPMATDSRTRPKGVKTHKEFRLEVIQQLVGSFSRRVPVKRRLPSSGVVLMDPVVALSHIPEKSDHNRNCQYCSKKSDKRVRTRVWCKDCTVNLCPLGCFHRYHAELCGIILD